MASAAVVTTAVALGGEGNAADRAASNGAGEGSAHAAGVIAGIAASTGAAARSDSACVAAVGNGSAAGVGATG